MVLEDDPNEDCAFEAADEKSTPLEKSEIPQSLAG
jgi:hypothetical protein